MTDVLVDVGSSSTLGWVAGVMTAVFMFFFAAWTLWAWWPGNRCAMERAARLPLDEDDATVGGGS